MWAPFPCGIRRDTRMAHKPKMATLDASWSELKEIDEDLDQEEERLNEKYKKELEEEVRRAGEEADARNKLGDVLIGLFGANTPSTNTLTYWMTTKRKTERSDEELEMYWQDAETLMECCAVLYGEPTVDTRSVVAHICLFK